MAKADAAGGAMPFAHYARIVGVDPITNRFRGYELRWQPALWGGSSSCGRGGAWGPGGR
jgi:hypothetical protein